MAEPRVTLKKVTKKADKALRRAGKGALKELGGRKKVSKMVRRTAGAAIRELTAEFADAKGGRKKSKKKK
jgi:hypothetical protein